MKGSSGSPASWAKELPLRFCCPEDKSVQNIPPTDSTERVPARGNETVLVVERGIVEQNVDDVKTDGSRKSLTIAHELLERLKTRKQETLFSGEDDWIFSSPLKLGRLSYSYTGVWRELQRAAKIAAAGDTFFPPAVGTSIAVQQKLLGHSDIRTTMNIYGDVVTDEMDLATTKGS